MLLCASGAFGDDPLRQAAEALEANDYAAAIPLLEAALQDQPGNANARFNLAYACQASGDEDAAIRHYRLIAEQRPDLISARQNLATLLMRAGEFSAAAAQYAAVAENRPEDTSVQLLLAEAHFRSGNPEASAAAYMRLVDAGSGTVEVLLGLARALVESQRLVEAVPYYLRAATLDPRVESMLPSVVDSLEQAGLRRDALELYRRYARNHPEDAAVQEEVGIRLLDVGNLRASRAALERAVAAEPNASRHAALAEVLRRYGDAGAAREQLRLATQAAPQDTAVRVRYATALLQAQDYGRAVQQYLAACETDPRNQDAWNGLALAAFQLENFAGALRALEEAEKLGHAPPASVYLKALALDRLQMYEEAQRAYSAFLAAAPEMPDEVWKAEQRLRTIGKVLAKR